MPIHAQTGPPASAQAISTTPTRIRMPLSIPPTFFFMVYLSFCSKTARRAGPVGIVSKPCIPLWVCCELGYCSFEGVPMPPRCRCGKPDGNGRAGRCCKGPRAGRCAGRKKRSVEGVAEGLGGHELHHLAGGDLDTGP